MKIKLISQGLTEENHYSFIEKLLEENEGNLVISSAYVNSKAIRAFSDKWKNTKLDVTYYVGIRNGVTSKQALQEIISTKAKLYTIDTGKVTVIYHPKAYFFYNDEIAKVVIGSANFTEGGLSRNIETGVFMELDRTNKDDEFFFNKLLSAYSHLEKDFPHNVVKIESNEDIEAFYNNGFLEDENHRIFQEYGNNKTGTTKNTPPMELHNTPMFNTAAKIHDKEIETEAVLTIDGQLKTEKLIQLWETKPLNRRDLSIPENPKSHPTGSMLLKKGNYDIDQQTYFRNEAFSGLNWEISDASRNYLEFAKLKCTIIINGVSRGDFELTVKNDTRTDTKSYEQKQPTATLLWGESRSIVSDEALLGAILKLYKADGKNEFVIDFSS